MSPNPILKVLSTFQKCEVQTLLMGGQACILYGAAEFSRDIDIALLCSEENLNKLRSALHELQGEQVFYPPLDEKFLQKGHACHFRCRHPEACGLRIDILSILRGCERFPKLWERREIIDLPGLAAVPVLSLPDLILAKKTQRDKDWPMIRRLVEADYDRNQENPSSEKVRFWMRECRTPSLLLKIVEKYPDLLDIEESARPLLALVKNRQEEEIAAALFKEQEEERAKDREYWLPLRRELEAMRLKG
ncbi:MAG: hypothetical protein HY717_12955 [Planctomycetes bacterium]|nr:hypothetical protein [Planctomycetota bacterium]